MLNDMSMFKKMKERITDEVNMATNKLQNLQIIDQLASSIGQQSRADQAAQNQQLPELSHIENQNRLQTRSNFSLFDAESKSEVFNEEEELNTSSEISPQHQLFNENSIIRLQAPTSSSNTNKNYPLNENHLHHLHKVDEVAPDRMVESRAVINVQELSSDLDDHEDEIEELESKEDCLDVEIDLLTDEPIKKMNGSQEVTTNGNYDTRYLERIARYKTKHKQVVRALRDISSELEGERRKFQLEKQALLEQITSAKIQLDSKQNEEHCKSSESSLVEPTSQNRNAAKVKDLEKLLAKCKESLKSKNAQIRTLRESLSEVDSFKDQIQGLKKELSEVREAHEFWTVSIAENKRVMHQEIENKNSEIDSYKTEIANVKAQVSDEKGMVRKLKSTIQDLENRLVGTSVAHQKERESLIRELATDKNNALKQLSREHELSIERVKLDLEKQIEASKLITLNKEEELMKSLEQNRLLQDKYNQSDLMLKEKEKTFMELEAQLGECKKKLDEEKQKNVELQEELDKKSSLEEQIEALSKEVAEKDLNESVMSITEFEYLKNIVHQFMLGREPLVLARVISAVFKFDQDQVEQICRIQEAIQNGYS